MLVTVTRGSRQRVLGDLGGLAAVVHLSMRALLQFVLLTVGSAHQEIHRLCSAASRQDKQQSLL